MAPAATVTLARRTLLQVKDGGSLFRFRCHTGHAYSLESLLTDITEKNGRRPLEFDPRLRGRRVVHATYGPTSGPRGEQPIHRIDSQTCRRDETTSQSDEAGNCQTAVGHRLHEAHRTRSALAPDWS